MLDAITGPVSGPKRSRSASDLETVKENRILHTEKIKQEELPFTPRRFQQIKANCLKVQEEIDAQLRLLKPKRPVKDVDELICSAHQACGVRPTQEEQCDQILPCPAWRVKAAKKLLMSTRTLRESILDRRTAANVAGGDDHDPSANTSDHAEHEDLESEASSRAGHAVGRKRHAIASPAAQMAQAAPQTEDVGTLQGAMFALQLFQSRHGRRHSEEGDSDDDTSESSASTQRPEDVVDAALVYDREALLQRDEELPSQRPSVHLATIEAGWPSAWRLDGSLKAMLED